MNSEIEAKFIQIDPHAIRSALQRLNATLIYPERLMRINMFDFPERAKMNATGVYKWGRVRDEGDKITMTMKQYVGETGIDNTKETELIVHDFDTACAFFEVVGLENTSEQEKRREKWEYDSAEIVIDTWPGLEPFVEIEAETEESVKSIAELLDLDYNSAVFGPTDMVYEKVLNIPIGKTAEIKKLTFKDFETELEQLENQS